jgi:DNA-binding NtrC family response regulator
VRELENVVERAVVLARGERIVEADLPEGEGSDAGDFFERVSQDLPTFEQLERRYLELVLEKTGGKKEKAAQILGINRRTLYRKEREYGLIALGDVDPNLEGALEGAPEVD